jgi:glycosyltransferase involved in cell wall biosynthesis
VASLRILGGHSVQAKRLLNGWANDGEIDAWIVPINPIPPKPFDRLLELKYIRTLVTQLCYWPLLFRELRRADVVHVFSASYSSFLLAPLPALIVARLFGKPVLMNYHSGEAEGHLRQSWIARTALQRHVAVNVVPSQFLKEVFSRFDIDAAVVFNTVDRRDFLYRARDLGRRPLALLSTRNFEPVYNVPCTLRAFAKVQARFPDATLTLIGSGPQESSLKALAAELGLTGVRFVGRVVPQEIPAYCSISDVYVQTPAADNMPLSILEAFASGLPVVSTAVGGVPAVLTDGVHGLLAPDDDADGIAARIIELVERPDYAKRLAAAAYQACASTTGNTSATRGSVSTVVWHDPLPAKRSKREKLRETNRHRSPPPSVATRVGVARARRAARRDGAHPCSRPPREMESNDIRRVLTDPVRQRCSSEIDRQDWAGVQRLLTEQLVARPARFVLNPASARSMRDSVLARWPASLQDATCRADRLLQGRHDFLGYRDIRCAANGQMDWHADPVHGRRAPLAFYADVPFLDPQIGDHKVIWELNRHQHWLQFARAAWLSGDARYAQAIVTQLSEWLRANPPFVGINWASMLEIGFRSLSWTWALHALLGMPRVGDGELEVGSSGWLVDMLIGLDRQLTHVERHLSYYFSPNTHLTGEALALYVVGTALPELAASTRWAHTGRRVLLDEIDRQILPDGGHAERSAHYQRYTLDFYLLAALTARCAGDSPSAQRFDEAVSRLADFTISLADDHAQLPLIGDDDGGMLWPISGPRVRRRARFARAGSGGPRPPSPCRLGHSRRSRVDRGTRRCEVHASVRQRVTSRLFADTGYFTARSADGSHAVLDVGPHGYRNGGHAHADALSLTLSA